MLLNEKHDLCWNEPLLNIVSDISKGMIYLHSDRKTKEADSAMFNNVIIHGDLKPENILMTEFGIAKLNDFGASTLQHQVSNSKEKLQPLRSYGSSQSTGSIIGTPLFCAPEILRGEAYDEKSDVYSFGMVLMNICIKEAEFFNFIVESFVISHGTKASQTKANIMKEIIQNHWRPISFKGNEQDDRSTCDNVDFYLTTSPKQIKKLMINCISPFPSKRPTFTTIYDLLSTVCSDEIHSKSQTLFHRCQLKHYFAKKNKLTEKNNLFETFGPDESSSFSNENGLIFSSVNNHQSQLQSSGPIRIVSNPVTTSEDVI